MPSAQHETIVRMLSARPRIFQPAKAEFLLFVNSVSLLTWRALGTRNGGEVISSDSY